MDVFVRRGRVIAPGDDSEGTRDRPPTAEGTQHKIANENKVPENNAQPKGAPQQAVPLNNNPLLKPLPLGRPPFLNSQPPAFRKAGRQPPEICSSRLANRW